MANSLQEYVAAGGRLVFNDVCGIPMNPFITQDRILSLAADFPLRPDDVFVVTYPKSGTTWMQQILQLLRNNGVDTGKDQLDRAIPWLDEPISDDIVKEMSSPRYFKSHVTYGLMPGGEPAKSPAKYIYVARNPKDTAVSMFYHCSALKYFEFTGNWNVFYDYFISNRVEGGSWFDHVLQWWKHSQHCDNILFVKYEDMHSELSTIVRRVAEFIQMPNLSDELIQLVVEKATFKAMLVSPSCEWARSGMSSRRKEGAKPFLRKGIIGDWQSHFTEEQSRIFDEMYRKKMEGTGLEFRFIQ